MVNAELRPRVSPTTRFLWRCLAGLYLFVQVASATGMCIDLAERAGGAQIHDPHQHHVQVDQVCASQVAAADQASAVDPISHLPVLGPGFAVATAAAVAARPTARATQITSPTAHVAPFLLFHRLQL